MPLFNKRQQSLETGSLTGGALASFLIGATPSAGVPVTTETAVGVPAVASAVTRIASTVAGVAVRQVDSDGVHSLNRLREHPNAWFDRFQFRELEAARVLLNGNAYHYVSRDGVGGVTGFHPLDPGKVAPKLVLNQSGEIIERVYQYTPSSGVPFAIPTMRILHIAGFGWDGICGKSIIQLHRESLGTVQAADAYAGKLFGNGNLMAGILTTDKRLTQESALALKTTWRERVQGLGNAHDVAVLDSGTKFEPLMIPPQEAQFIQARMFGVEEVARMFGIPISFLSATSTGATSSTVTESEIIYFVQFTLDNLCRRIDAAYERLLLPEGTSFVHVTAPLIKADSRTRASASVMWRKSRVKSINEIRAEEGLAPLQDAEADDPLSDIGADGDGGQDPGTNDGSEEHVEPQSDVVI